MSIIGNWTATPNRVEMLINFLRSNKKKYKKKDLEALFTPLSSVAFREIYAVLDSLNLVEIENDIVKLNISDSKVPTPQIIKNAIFKSDFFNKDNFVLALAWLMLQDSNSIDSLEWKNQVNNHVLKDLNEEFRELDLTNNSCWQHFIYWCTYLGFATKIYIAEKVYICPDPTQAIEHELKIIFKEKKELLLKVFFNLLAKSISVLEFGSVRDKVMDVAREGLRLSDNQLSFATSLALLRLETRGLIKLEQKSDADSMSLQNGDETRIISHISYIGK